METKLTLINIGKVTFYSNCILVHRHSVVGNYQCLVRCADVCRSEDEDTERTTQNMYSVLYRLRHHPILITVDSPLSFV